MGYRFSRADVSYLTSRTGRKALDWVADRGLSAAAGPAEIEVVRRRWGEWTGALVQTVRLRQKAGDKLTDAGDWLFTDDALQQATASAVAHYRASRLAGRVVHDVTCSIGSELAELWRVCPTVVGSDLDPVRLAMARHNVPDVPLVRSDALRPVSTSPVILADPARRSGQRRIRDPAHLQPPLPDLLEAYRDRELVVKCAPGLDFGRLNWPGEIELVSLDGGVREACLWPPALTESGLHRRATILTSDNTKETYTDLLSDDIPSGPPGRWIIDPDGAVVRAGLVRHYAATHGLWQLDPHIAYLTGDHVPPGVRGFLIMESLPFREKTLRVRLQRLQCGPLEILTRGVTVDPDALRRRLKPVGTMPISLIITRIGSKPTVFVCTTPVAVE